MNLETGFWLGPRLPDSFEARVEAQQNRLTTVKAQEEPEVESLEAAIPPEIERSLESSNISVKYYRDETTKAMVLEMVNSRTGEPVLQLPSEVTLRLSAAFVRSSGNFIDLKG